MSKVARFIGLIACSPLLFSHWAFAQDSAPSTPTLLVPTPVMLVSNQPLTTHPAEVGKLFSEEGAGQESCGGARVVRGIDCVGKRCDNLRLLCDPYASAPQGGLRWTRWFSEEGDNDEVCRSDEVMTALRCNGSYCDNLSLGCRQTATSATRCRWTSKHSEEQRAFIGAPGSVIRGIRCSGSHCDNKQYFTCQAQNDQRPTYLAARLTKPLKAAACGGSDDQDTDCLVDGLEDQLGAKFAPTYFYDEDDDCHTGQHYKRRDFFQVRPADSRVTQWSATDGQRKLLTITYFFAFPHDCQSYFFGAAGGHQGDSEHVRYTVETWDLKNFYIAKGRYWHHGSNHEYSGERLAQSVWRMQSSRPLVAGDEDGKGSWPGVKANSSHCSGSEDNFYNDCFVKTMGSDFRNNRHEVAFGKNIGGPPPESWRADTVTVDGQDAYSTLNVGHGSNREYWTQKAGFDKFCGWECRDADRKSGGDCRVSAHSERSCTSPLRSKVADFNWQSSTPPAPVLTPWFSEEGSGQGTCPSGFSVRGIGCNGGHCDNLQLNCYSHPGGLTGSTTWTPFFSEEQPNSRSCASGQVLTKLRCKGRRCDNLSLGCRTSASNRSDCRWTSRAYSEEDPAFNAGAGRSIVGIRCSGSYCDNKKYRHCRFN